ncbi:hypothetical protein [Chryseobacterium contaminans]|uniref:hypothetical protein n=1 Tax=Chryseobacterium contaminans TaxID=1423959 RepID=UPI000F4F1939|nr:hypothetical protein [Chryseobacterium contaminans]
MFNLCQPILGRLTRYSPEIGIIAVGALGLLVISVLATPKKLPYRAESYIFPVVLCVGTAVLIYFYFPEWFSFYPLARVINIFRQ